MPEIHRKLSPEMIAATAVDELTELRRFLRQSQPMLRDPHDRSAFEIAAIAMDEALSALAEVGLSSARIGEVAEPVRVFDYGRLGRALRARALSGVAHLVQHNLSGVLELLDCLAADHPHARVREIVARQRAQLAPSVEMMHRLAEPRAA
jgi:hypothetical protein